MRFMNAKRRRSERRFPALGGAPLALVLGLLVACGPAETREDLEGEPFVEDEPTLHEDRYDNDDQPEARPPTAERERPAPPVERTPRGAHPPDPERAPPPPPPAERERAPEAVEERALIPAGTELRFEVEETVSTQTHREGDTFSLRLVQGVAGEGGARLAQGVEARGVVTAASRSAGPDDEAILAIRVESIRTEAGTRTLNGEVVSAELETDRRDSPQRSAAKVATGAAAGAVIGHVLGRDRRSAVAGAAAGAVAGLGVALTTRDGHAVLPGGSVIAVRLAEPLVVN